MIKRINYKKRVVIHGLSTAVFLGACLGLQANDQDKNGVSAQATVNTDRSTTSSTDRTRDQTYTATSDQNNNNGKLSRGDANFIREAAQGGLMEVKLGQTAKDHAQNSDVKNYGDMLVKDHSKANDRLSQLASQKGVNLAKDMEAKHTGTIKDVEKKSGADFDRAFIEDAIKDHRKDIAKFERASRDLNDSELKAFATETLPTLRNHLAEAERIAKSLGLNITARNVDTDINHDRTAEAAAAAGSPGLAISSANSSVNRVDVDVDKSDHSVEVSSDRDASIGAPASSEKGASANAEVHTDKDHTSAKATTLSYNDLPAKVQDTIKAQGGSADNVKNVKKHTANGKVTYQVKVNNKTLRIAEDGTIVKESGNNK